MAGFDYGRMQRTASRLLDRFKQGVVTLTRVTPGAVDPEEPWVPTSPTTSVATLSATVNGVSAEYIDGTIIVSSDLEAVIAVPAVKPSMTDIPTVDGVAHVMKRVMQIPAAGTAVAYRLIFGGGASLTSTDPGDYVPSLDFSIIANSQYIPLFYIGAASGGPLMDFSASENSQYIPLA